MLKTCWDCIAGDQQRRNDDPYRVHLNGTGGTQGWQSISDGNMFPLPTLRARNQIKIIGLMTQDKRLNISVSTQNSTVCQINVANRMNEIDQEDYVQIQSHGNGVSNENKASDLFRENGTEYVFRFVVDKNGSSFDIFVAVEEDGADTYLHSIDVDVNSLKYISVTGEVEKLIYIFKSDA